MKAVVAAFNQEKALVGAFSVIVQPVVEPMDRFAALVVRYPCIIYQQQQHHRLLLEWSEIAMIKIKLAILDPPTVSLIAAH